jgi:alanine racemase
MNRRTDPLLVALMLVAHVVAQTAVDWDEVVSSTEHFIHSSTHIMVADTVRVGLAIYGLQQLKRRQQMKGLTVEPHHDGNDLREHNGKKQNNKHS